MRYGLVIFDNDGVLVDSEPISNRILAAYLTELGHATTYEESVRDYMGGAVQRVHDLVEQRSGQLLPDDFDDELHRRVFEAFQNEFTVVPRAAEVLAALEKLGIPTCVASSSSRERIRVALSKVGLYDH